MKLLCVLAFCLGDVANDCSQATLRSAADQALVQAARVAAGQTVVQSPAGTGAGETAMRPSQPVTNPVAVRVIRPAQAATEVGRDLLTGSLLVSSGDCLAIKTFTGSPYTHVGMVVLRRGQPFVYDSTGGYGVRCQTLENYLRWLGPHPVAVYQPLDGRVAKQSDQLEQYLDAQLGRPYAVTHHLTGERCDGVHCAEYLTDALMEIRLISAKQPPRVSPGSLVSGLTKHGLYAAGPGWVIQEPPAPPRESWCSRCAN